MNNYDDFEFDEDSELGKLFKLLNSVRTSPLSEDGILSLSDDGKEDVELLLSDLTGRTEPDKIEKFTEDGMDFVIKYWILPEGGEFKTVDIICEPGKGHIDDLEARVSKILLDRSKPAKVSVESSIKPKPNRNLEMELQEAVKTENFEAAIELRDLIKERELRLKERDEIMKPIIALLNEAIAAQDLDACDKYVAQLKKIKNDYL